jgi:hypothetical protein
MTEHLFGRSELESLYIDTFVFGRDAHLSPILEEVICHC